MKVFLSGDAFRGNVLGGLGGANTLCTDAAHTQGNSGDWTAWLSDNTADAVDRIFDAGRPYQTLDGTIIANNLADLTDGTLDAPIMIDEAGNEITGNAREVWSATGADGTYTGQGTCKNWADPDPTLVAGIGDAGETDEKWTNVGGGNNCNLEF